MAEISAIEKEVPEALQECLKSLRPIMRRAMELSAGDVSAIVAEPILGSLGWETRNPAQVRRPDTGAALKLLASGKTAMTIHTVATLTALPETLSGDDEDTGEWIVVTNGKEWKIFSQHHRTQPFRSFTLENAAAAREAAPILAMLQKDAFQKDGLTQAWLAEAVDQDIERALARHLDASPALVDAVKSGLSEQGMTISDEVVRAALSRISISLGDKVVTGEPAAEAAPATEPKPAAAKTTGRKRGPAAKPAAKSTAKKADAKPTAGKPARGAKGKAAASTAKASATKATAAAKSDPAPAKSETGPVAAETTSEAKAEAPKKTSAAKGKSAAAKAGPKGRVSKSTKPRSGKSAAARNVTLPTSVDELGWPDEATHSMHRKKNIVFMKLIADTQESILLPGSLIVADVGKALNTQMKQAREQALTEGKIAPYGAGMLEIKEPISLHSPRAAASFAAATLVKDLAAWKDKSGDTLKDALDSGAVTLGEPVPATAATAAEEAVTA